MESLANLDSLESSINENDKNLNGYIHIGVPQSGIFKLNRKQKHVLKLESIQ